MKKIIILAFISLVGQSAHAQIREFQTTRLMSTSGAGVASILSTEAAVLNPAASSFFNDSSMSYQSYNTSLQKKNDARNALGDSFPKQNRSQGLFLSDNTSQLKGGVAYLTQDENHYERTRMTLHGAAPIGTSTAMGVSYNYISDTLPKKVSPRHTTSHQASVGLTHIVDEDTILGAVIIDPTRTLPGEERALVGFQYSLAERFTLIGDIGAQYTKAVSDKYLWRGAIQLNVFSDFFIRGGQFYDNINKLKGNSWGASWIGPRFGVEFAQRYSQQFSSGYVYEEEKLVDTSLSAIIKF